MAMTARSHLLHMSRLVAIIGSLLWADGPNAQAGAVTWGNGNTGTTGVVSSTNSLVGTHTGDRVSFDSVDRLSDDSYVVFSPNWVNGVNANAGAVSLLPGTGPSSGPINNSNSVLGSAANGGSQLVWDFDCVNKQLVVGRPADNIVTLFIGVASCRQFVYLPIVVR